MHPAVSLRSKYPNRRHVPQTMISIPNFYMCVTPCTYFLFFDTLDPLGAESASGR